MTTSEWLDRLAPKALAVLAVGTCATYGGIHAMAGNPTGAMGVPDYLGWKWKSKAGLPIVCVPGCPAHPDNLSETLLYCSNRPAPVPERVEDQPDRHGTVLLGQGGVERRANGLRRRRELAADGRAISSARCHPLAAYRFAPGRC